MTFKFSPDLNYEMPVSPTRKLQNGKHFWPVLLILSSPLIILALKFYSDGFDVDEEAGQGGTPQKPFPKSNKHASSSVSPELLKEPSRICDSADLSADTLYVEEHFEEMEQDDPRLIRYVRSRYMTPSRKDKPYQIKVPMDKKSTHASWIRRFYNDKRDGIFVEAGANDGEPLRDFGWSGVLIECNPKVFPLLRDVNRKAWTADVCLATTKHPQIIKLSVPVNWAYSARIGKAWDLRSAGVDSNWTNYDNIEGVPLYTILTSVGIYEVDFFSLDIEGTEFDVLKAFPFDKILTKVLIVEVYFLDQAKQQQLKDFLLGKGLRFKENIEMNHIYVHETLF